MDWLMIGLGVSAFFLAVVCVWAFIMGLIEGE